MTIGKGRWRHFKKTGCPARGFSYDDVSVVSFALPPNAYDDARLRTFMTDLSAPLRTMPAVSFGFASFDPFGEGGSATGMRLPGESEAQTKPIDYLDVSPGYFEILRIPIVAGRHFETADAGRNLAVINESMARRYWPGQSALGHSFITG